MTGVVPPATSAASTQAPRAQASRRRRGSIVGPPGAFRAGRAVTVVVLLAGLAFSVVARMWAMALQDAAVASGPYGSPTQAGNVAARSASFGSMDSFALALLLGGLRGPLVMFLWVSSEAQKNEKDLEDFDTKIEWIRLLQPEFDTVLIFQMWNKAYNISVQLASLPDRYSTILDALEYGKDMLASRPKDINVLLAIDQVYANKLGSTNGDKTYYIREVRRETMARGNARGAHAGAPRRELPPMLDAAGNLLPRLLAGANPPPPPGSPEELQSTVIVPAAQINAFAQAAAAASVILAPQPTRLKHGERLSPGQFVVSEIDDAKISRGDREYCLTESEARRVEPAELSGVLYIYTDWDDGSELQYLRRYQPFVYGLSPIALGYNYGKRAQVLMNEGRQKPVQMSKGVVDSKPATELRQWGEDEWERATDLEMQAFGKALSPETAAAGPGMGIETRGQKELLTRDVRIGGPMATPASESQALAASAVDSYALTGRLCRDSRAEYVRHLTNADYYINRFQDYSSTLDSLKAEEALVTADHDFLQAAMLPAGPVRLGLMKSSMEHYRAAALAYKYLMLRYYMPGDVVAPLCPPGYTRETVHQLLLDNPGGFEALYEKLDSALKRPGSPDLNAVERNDYSNYMKRATARQVSLASSLSPAGNASSTTRPATAPSTEPSQTPVTGPFLTPTTGPGQTSVTGSGDVP